MAAKRIYRVTIDIPNHDAVDHLVEASTKSQAVAHVCAQIATVEVAGQKELIEMIKAGVEVQQINAEPAADPAVSP